jgi:general nucleoside transport system permease protein
MHALEQIIPILAATIRVAVPLVLAGFAGLFSERSGVVDVGLEGKMLAGAFAAAAVASITGSVWLGLLAAMAVAAMLGLLHGFVCITQRGDQVVAGVAINILISGLTLTLGLAWFAQGGQTPPLPPSARFSEVVLPLSGIIGQIPVLGPLYTQVLGGQNILVYPTFALVPLAWWVLFSTRFGLRIRAVGENPAAVDTSGVSVVRLRYAAVLIAGALCGIAGAYISTAQGAGFVRDMTGGRGFLALAALVLGKWRPWTTLGGCLLFAALDALAIRLQGVVFPGLGPVPVEFVQMVPYVMTIVLLAGFVGRAIPPRASGRPYVKDR